MQVFFYSTFMEDTWDSLAISVIFKMVQNYPEEFLEAEIFANLAVELCLPFIFKFLQSANATSPCHPSWEDLISVSLMAAKALLLRFGLKKQLQSLLAYFSIGYRCIEGASTESCFSTANEFVQSIILLLKNHVDDKSNLCDDGIFLLRTIIGACVDLFGSLTKQCIERIHLHENKRSNSCKLLQMKLAFSLEQVSLFAKLSYEIGSFGDDQEKGAMLFTVLGHCNQYIQTSLTDQDIQIQSIGLQVLRRILLHGTNAESSHFLIFFASELLEDVITIVQQKLVKPINMEAISVTGECLKVLMLLQTSSNTTECQKGLMHLLLEAVVLVFSTLENDVSQANDLRNLAIRLVSQLAQIPKSAIRFKDILLAMPVSRREQLQVMIRASVMQDEKSTQAKSSAPPLVIKLPAQAEESKVKYVPPSSTTERQDNDSEEEEEDDWDAFQSFSASANEVDTSAKVEGTTKSPISDDSTENNKFQDDNISSHDIKEFDDYHQQVENETMPSNKKDDNVDDRPSLVTAEGYNEPSHDQHEVKARGNTNLAEEYNEPDGAYSNVESDKEESNRDHMEPDEVKESKAIT